MQILIWYDDDIDRTYYCGNEDELQSNALAIVRRRLEEGYLVYPDDAEEKAKAILEANDGAAAWKFLQGRNDHEYERVELTTAENA